jgi:hypothetical protein
VVLDASDHVRNPDASDHVRNPDASDHVRNLDVIRSVLRVRGSELAKFGFGPVGSFALASNTRRTGEARLHL